MNTGKQAARQALGLEAALVDHATMTVVALDPADDREVDVEVAGLAAMIVAKAHKLHDRVVTGNTDRLSDKDASDVYRIMQTAAPGDATATLQSLLDHPMAGEVTDDALTYRRVVRPPGQRRCGHHGPTRVAACNR